MAKFDVYRIRRGDRLVLDCQANLLDDLNTRFVVPLLALPDAPKPAARLNPILMVGGRRLVMATQFAAAVPVRDLNERVVSLLDDQDAIGDALDMLIYGV